MEYTNIYDVAKQLKVSHTTIYNKLKNKDIYKVVKPHLKKIKRVTHVDKEGIDILKGYITIKDTKKNKAEPILEPNIKESFYHLQETLLVNLQDRINQLENDKEYLKKELDSRNNHIETQAKLIENSQVLLREQKLLLESIEAKNEAKKNWWKFWNKNKP